MTRPAGKRPVQPAYAGVLFTLVLAAVSSGASGAPARPAGAYPDRPIRFIVPFPPGGGTDIVARVIAARLSEQTGQQTVVDNRGGANAIIGTQLGARAAPDGYTMLFALPASIAVNPNLYRDLPYDPSRDFAPVIQLNTFPLLLAAHPSVKADTVSDLVALARSQPGRLNFGSSGNGSAAHLSMEMLKSMAKLDMVHVPYKGGGQALSELVAGQVQLMCGTVISQIPFVRNGRLKAIAVTSPKRAPVLPDVPAVAETLPGYEITNWHGILVPRGTPAVIVQRLNAEIARALAHPEVRERFAAQGADIVGGNPGSFATLIAAEIARYRKVLRDAGIRQE